MKFPVFTQPKMSETYKNVLCIAKAHNKKHNNDENIMYCPYCGRPLEIVEGRTEPLETLAEHVSCVPVSQKVVYKCKNPACVGRYAMYNEYGSMYTDIPEKYHNDKDAYNALYSFVHLKSHFLSHNYNAINSFDYQFDMEHPVGTRPKYMLKWVDKLCKFLHFKTVFYPVIETSYTYDRWGKRKYVSYKMSYYVRDNEIGDGTYIVKPSIWRQFKSNIQCAQYDYRAYMNTTDEQEKQKHLKSLYGYNEFTGKKLTGIINNITSNIIVPVVYGWFKGVKHPNI